MQYDLFENDDAFITETDKQFHAIRWESIDYDIVTKAQNICKLIKDYYWEQRLLRKDYRILPDTPAYQFLVKSFTFYHPDWYEKTHGMDIDYFYVDNAPDGQNNQCLYFEIAECKLDDNHLGYSCFKKGGGVKKERDVKKCCREAIRSVKTEAVKNAIGSVCPVTHDILTIENIDIHHENLSFRELVEKWIALKGGVDVLYEKVNSTIGNGAITKFVDDELEQDFIAFHNANTHLIPVTRIGHRILHNKS